MSRAFQGKIIDGVPRPLPLFLRENPRRGSRYAATGA
jgi:hypothetical protein